MKIIILITCLLISSMAYATSAGISSEKFFDDLALAMNNPKQKREAVRLLNKFGADHKKNAEKALRKEFESLRSRLPIEIDKYTQLDSVDVFSNAVRYNFHLSQEYLDSFSVSDFKSNVRELTKNEVCSNPRMFFLVILDFRFIHFYYAPDNTIIKEITITEKDCV